MNKKRKFKMLLVIALGIGLLFMFAIMMLFAIVIVLILTGIYALVAFFSRRKRKRFGSKKFGNEFNIVDYYDVENDSQNTAQTAEFELVKKDDITYILTSCVKERTDGNSDDKRFE